MPQNNNFDEINQLLEPFISRGKPHGNYTLDKMRGLMKHLGNPQDAYKTIHVAGTSGKTSTCYYLAALLVEAGQKVGLTVSPHVDNVNERVQIGLEPLPAPVFLVQLKKFLKLVDASGLKPSYFELMVAFAFWQFAQEKVDYAVVEVGLGGLLDGTNVIHRPDKICVITDIGLDHTSVLGNTMAKIATQKAGIIQDHNSIFMYRQAKDVMEQVEDRCRQMHASLHLVSADNEQATFKQRNFFLAKNVYDFVATNEGWPKLSRAKLQNSADISIPARMEEFIYKNKTIIIDGSHNGQKMAALVSGIKHNHPKQTVALLVSIAEGEAQRAPEAFAQLKHLSSKVIVTSFAGEQDVPKVSYDAEVIADIAQQAGFEDVKIIKLPEDAFIDLCNQPEDLLVVTGSFYLLNHIRPLILKS